MESRAIASLSDIGETARSKSAVRRGLLLVALCAAFALGEGLILRGRGLGYDPWWVWILFPLFFYAASIQFLLTAKRITGPDRKVWLCFGLACLAEGSGEAVWGLYDLFSGVGDPYPAPAYLAYFSFSTLIIVGFWYSMQQEASRRVSLVQLGNLATLFSAILLAYLFLFYGFLESPVPHSVAFISIGYCILGLSAFLFGIIVASLRLSGRMRRVMFPVLAGVGIIAITDYHFTYIVLNSSYHKTNPLNGAYLLSSCLFIWAAFERRLISTDSEPAALSPRRDDRARLWETQIIPISVATVLVIAFAFRERLTADLFPYIAGASALFILSLSLRNWWGQQLENQLREKALASESQLLVANRELLAEMESRTRAEEDLRQSQKMEAIGQLTGGVAHDFNNLLAVILGNLELVDAPEQDATARRAFVHEAIDAANRGARLTQRLLALSRKQALKPEPIDVGALLEDMRSMLERTLGETIRVEIQERAGPLHCMADYAQLESVLLNLAINARDAMPEGGRLAIEVSDAGDAALAACEAPDAPRGCVVISVRDTGAGIPEHALDRVFDPFFTTKDIGKGTGLGLSMAYGFANQSGGRIAIESKVGEGTEVRLYLPKMASATYTSSEGRATDIPIGRGERVLLVEDEDALRRFVERLLSDLHYSVIAVGDGEQALDVLGDCEPLDLILSDVVLPGSWSGPRLAKKIKQRHPKAAIVLMSGYAENVRAKEGALWPAYPLIQKPFRRTDLARTIRAAIDREHLADSAPASETRAGQGEWTIPPTS